MVRPISILVGLHSDQGFDREAFSGVAAGARAHGHALLHMKGREQSLQDAFDQHDAHGAIISTSDPAEIQRAVDSGRPCVNIANHLPGHAMVPVVGNDDVAIGRLVAEHYLNRGFRHFAFYTDVRQDYFMTRARGFADAVCSAGFECAVGPPAFDETKPGAEANWDEHVSRWIAALPRPLAVMAAFDTYACEVLTGCALAGLHVPDEVSVVGVDNDELICLTASTQLSSVATLASRIGHEAVGVLLSLIRGEPPPPDPILMPPGQIVVRASSSEMATIDSSVVSAIQFIRARLAFPIGVGDVVEHVAISRRALERRFLATLQRTPLDEIRRARVERAKALLIETDLSLSEIAKRSGLVHQQRLSTLIKGATGQTPRAFRATFRQSR